MPFCFYQARGIPFLAREMERFTGGNVFDTIINQVQAYRKIYPAARGSFSFRAQSERIA